MPDWPRVGPRVAEERPVAGRQVSVAEAEQSVEELTRRVGLAAREHVHAVYLPAAEQVADHPALFPHDRNVVEEVHSERVRAVYLRNRALARACAERGLSVRRSYVETARAGACEDFAGVVNRLAPRVGRADGQSVVEEAAVVTRLHRMVD